MGKKRTRCGWIGDCESRRRTALANPPPYHNEEDKQDSQQIWGFLSDWMVPGSCNRDWHFPSWCVLSSQERLLLMRQERRHFQPSGSKRITEWLLARNHTQMQRYLLMIALPCSHSSIPQSQRKGTIRQHYRWVSSMMVNLLNQRRSHGQLSILSSELYNMTGPSCRVSSTLPWILPVERRNTSSLGRSIHHCPSHSSLAISTWDAL